MPGNGRTLSLQAALDHVRERSFLAGAQIAGAEVEWVVVDDAAPGRRPSLDRLAVASDAARNARVTFEPGGQLELSSAPGSIADVCRAIAADRSDVAAALAQNGLSLHGIGLDPVRRDERLVSGPRYDAMEAYFDTFGPEGRRMMCGTAAIQINVDAGDGDDVDGRWRLAHALGPTLIAAFANSPIGLGRPTGWRSTRMANWWRMDPTRTWPATGSDAAPDAWASYVLRARVMMVRDGDKFVPVTRPMTFAEWIERGHPLGYPTVDDLDYHATTLFPPVRARGWLEIRYLDAQSDPWWRAATGITIALMNDRQAAERAARATAQTAGMWLQAARDGLTDSRLAASATECVQAAIEALPRAGGDPETIEAAREFYDCYVSRGRCPADDALDAFEQGTLPEGIRVAG